jgi:inhibitor of cysteine peptidase
MVLIITFSAATIANESNVYTEDKPNIALDAEHTEFTIKLKSNPTTGYAWFLREYNHHLITPVKHSFQTGNAKLIGASGYELWTFKMSPAAFVVPQQMIIRFVYARPWQGAENSTQVVFRVTTR